MGFEEIIANTTTTTIAIDVNAIATTLCAGLSSFHNLVIAANGPDFGWVKFNMDADKVVELKKKLDLDPNIIRFLVLKTVKENTIAAKRFVRSDMHRKPMMKKSESDEVVAPINKEEIDKEIDAMVAL